MLGCLTLLPPQIVTPTLTSALLSMSERRCTGFTWSTFFEGPPSEIDTSGSGNCWSQSSAAVNYNREQTYKLYYVLFFTWLFLVFILFLLLYVPYMTADMDWHTSTLQAKWPLYYKGQSYVCRLLGIKGHFYVQGISLMYHRSLYYTYVKYIKSTLI